MAATTMPSISSLTKRLSADYPAIRLEQQPYFRWSDANNTISYTPSHPEAAAHLLHEYGHANLKHSEYTRDIELLRMEQEAWSYAASELATRYAVSIEDAVVQDALDTYREWIHSRSACPSCHATGVQKNKDLYHCLACGQKWQVNEARTCGLRRRATPKTKDPLK